MWLVQKFLFFEATTVYLRKRKSYKLNTCIQAACNRAAYCYCTFNHFQNRQEGIDPSSLKTLIFCMFHHKMSIQQIISICQHTQDLANGMSLINKRKLTKASFKNFHRVRVTYLLKYEWKCEIFFPSLVLQEYDVFLCHLIFSTQKRNSDSRLKAASIQRQGSLHQLDCKLSFQASSTDTSSQLGSCFGIYQ